MDILPLNLLSELDEELFGQEMVNLSRLKRAGFPVLNGAVVLPSKEVLEKISFILTKTSTNGRSDLSKNQFKDIDPTAEFKKVLNHHKKFLLENKLITSQLWQEILTSWWSEFMQKYKHFDPDLNPEVQLSAKVIFFLDEIKQLKEMNLINCIYNEIYQDTILKSDKKFAPKTLHNLDLAIRAASRFLVFPYNYTLIYIGNSFFITKLTPFTSSSSVNRVDNQVVKIPKKYKPQTVTQLFFNLPVSSLKSFLHNLKQLEFDTPNFFIISENFKDFDSIVLSITAVAESYPTSQIIYKLPDLKEHGLRGALRLIAQPEMINQSAKIVLFLRNKKQVQNLQLALPFVRTVDELIKLKRELSAYGVNRKGSLKIWLEINTPDNLLNIEKCLEAGVDGILVNLDELEFLLIGFKSEEEKGRVLALDSQLKLLENLLRITQKIAIPVIIKGQNILKNELVEVFINLGISGLVVNSLIEAEALPYYFALAERKLVEKRLQLLN